MNGKKAKKLRKIAQRMSVGSPMVGYEEKQHTRHIGDQVINIGKQTMLVTGCTRGVYQDLKHM